MKSLFLALALALPAAAQKQAQKAPDPVVPSELFIHVDRELADLSASVKRFQDCVEAAAFLNSDALQTKQRLGGNPPSHLAGLLPAKTKAADNKRRACLLEGTQLGARFDDMLSRLATFQPPNARGLQERRQSLGAQRVKLNGLLAQLGARPAKGQKLPAEDAPRAQAPAAPGINQKQ